MATTQIGGAQIRDGGITDADVATANKDGTAGTPSMRTLGTGAQQACSGNDARLSDARPASDASDFLRIDGTSPLIADWDSGGVIVSNVGELHVNAALSAEDCTFRDASVRDLTISGDITVGGGASTGTGVAVRATSPTITTPVIAEITYATPKTREAGGIARDLLDYRVRQPRMWLKNRSDTAFVNVGMTAAPTVTTSTAAASGDTTNCPLLTIDTAASTNSVCNIISTAAVCHRAYLPTLVWKFRTAASIASLRLWCGFAAGTLSLTSTPTTINCAAFRYDTSVDGTAFWRCVTSTGAAVTTTTTTQSIATGTEYNMRIEMDAGNVAFYINDVRVALHTTNLPGSTTSLKIESSCTTLENVAKGFRSGSMTLLHV